VLASLFVIFLVEPSYQLLENRAHRVIVEALMLHRPVCVQDRIGTQVQPGVEEFLDQRPERVCLRESRGLIPKFEVLEDFLDVRRESVEIGFKVCFQLLLASPVAQVP
jgi:hypothetical protein